MLSGITVAAPPAGLPGAKLLPRGQPPQLRSGSARARGGAERASVSVACLALNKKIKKSLLIRKNPFFTG